MKYLTITQPNELLEFCKQLKKCQWFAIDTEFLRRDTFFPILCLIQIQTDQGQAALIDPLAFEHPTDSLAPLWQCLTHPNITKVFHSARQDIEVLFQLSGQLPVSIFDTQIAGVFLGYGQSAGLAKMVGSELDIFLPKDQTQTDWHQRPLTPKQLNYALDDVRTLAPLYEKIQSKLTELEKEALHADFNALLTPELYELAPEKAGQRIKGAGNLSPKQWGIVNALSTWRENFAIEHNRPRRWSLADDCLVAIAKRPPKTVEALYKVPNIKIESVKAYGEQWIACIDEVFAHSENWPAKPPKPAKPTQTELKLMDLCWAYLAQVSQNTGVPLNQITHKDTLLLICRQPEPIMIGWRHFLLEMPLRALLSGQATLSIQSQNINISMASKSI